MAGLSEHFRLEEVADGVHAAIATPAGFGLCNAAIIDLGGTTLVFDAMLTPQAGAALGRAAERLTGRPVGVLVQSHYHGDHVRGSAAVGAAHVVSTRRVRDLVLERGPLHLRGDRDEVPGELERLRSGATPALPEEREVLEGWYGGILATPADLEFRPPDLTFESELLVHGRRRSARLLTFGGGHSPSDVLLVLPDERFLCLGDLLSVGFHPSLSDGNPEELSRILREVRALPTDRALPGHGPVSDAAGIAEMEGYVTALRGLARAALDERADRETFVGRPPPGPYARWKFTTIYRANVGFLYDRLRDAGPTAGPA
ncbi:MAG TPA: MBL fold metallo-hydrolase [Thermoplasmata archaeon]|nr:MBL fold metallo-hydrolase [Thermoplasmata archaeon]